MSIANDSILTMLGYGGGSASYNTVNGAGAPDDAASAERLRLSVPITPDQLEAACRTGVYQQLAARLITAALSELPTVSVGGDVDQGERLQDRLAELGAWTQTKIAACAAERWGVAGLLIRTSSPGTDLERPLSFPVDGKILELLPITRGEMKPLGWVHEMWSPNFLQPRLIELRLQLPDGIGHATRVHPSRVILFRGPRQDGTMIDATSIGDGWDKYGLPLLDRLRSVLPLLLVLDRETSRQVQQQGVVVRTLSPDGAAMMMDRDGVSGLEAGIAYASRVLSSAGQQVLLPNETLERLSSGSEVWDKVELAVYHLACLALGWPLELVNGQPPPGLGDSGKGAQLSFRPLVEGVQREKLAIPAMEMCRVVLTEMGLPDARPNVVFGDPLSPTPAERANIRLQHTQSDALAVQAGIMPAEYFAQRYTSADGWREDLEPYVPDVAPIEGMPTTEPGPAPGPGPAPEPTLTGDAEADELTSNSCMVALRPTSDTEGQLAGIWSWLETLIPGFVKEQSPHVTLLYAGDVPARKQRALNVVASGILQGENLPAASAVTRLRAFDGGADGVPIVLALGGGGLQRLHRILLAKLAPLVTMPQYPVYVPHLTLGYAPELSPEQLAELQALTHPSVIEFESAVVCIGKRDVTTIAVGG